MKIAFLNIYQNKVNRGSETFVQELSQRLSKNHSVEIISDYNIDRSQKDRSGSWQRRLFVDYWSLSIAKFTLSVTPSLLKNKFDIVIPLNGGWQVAIVRIITWLSGGKMVVSGQSGMGWDDRNNLWSFPNAFVALSSKALSWAKKVMPPVRSLYIPNGVDLNKFTPKGEVFEISLKKPIVLAVGAFTEQKRLDLVIKAVSKIGNASLLIAGGGGELKDRLEAEGKKILGDRFRIIHVPFADMPKIYRCCDVFTLPSASSEAFGNVLTEAMATDLPVVATDDPIRSEIIGDAGTLVDPTDVDVYAKSLKKALETSWDGEPRKQAEKFDWDKIAEQYEELFKTLVKET